MPPVTSPARGLRGLRDLQRRPACGRQCAVKITVAEIAAAQVIGNAPQEFIAQAVRDLSGELQQLRERRIADRKRRLTAEVRYRSLEVKALAEGSGTISMGSGRRGDTRRGGDEHATP
jgi:hypothetical protein